ncbi:MAG TPA: hypothetical protein VFL43_17910 [Variovorax sp.]|nr:hypothetical protein [Variovorax sp.]
MRGLFLVNVKLGRGSNGTLPSTLAGAYVSAYATAPDPESAIRLAVSKLTSKGFEFLATQGPISRLDPREWSRHVAQSWPEFIDELPKQDDIEAGLEREMVFFGPFVGYERAPEGSSPRHESPGACASRR